MNTTSERTVRTDTLQYHLSHQRPLDTERAQYIADNFDEALFQVPDVAESENGESLEVIDGWTRVSARMLAGRGADMIRVTVHHGLTSAEKSELFLQLNGTPKDGSKQVKTRVPVGLHDTYRVGVNAGRQALVEISRIVRSYGLSVGRAKGQDAIRAVKPLLSAYAKGNLDATLKILTQWDAYAMSGNTSVFAGQLITGVSDALHLYGDALDPVSFLAQLDVLDPERVLKAVQRAQSSGKYVKAQRWVAAVEVLRSIYNTHRNGRSKLASPESILLAAEGTNAP